MSRSLEQILVAVRGRIDDLEVALGVARYDAARSADQRDRAEARADAAEDRLRRMLVALDAIARSDTDDPVQLRAMARLAIYGTERS